VAGEQQLDHGARTGRGRRAGAISAVRHIPACRSKSICALAGKLTQGGSPAWTTHSMTSVAGGSRRPQSRCRQSRASCRTRACASREFSRPAAVPEFPGYFWRGRYRGSVAFAADFGAPPARGCPFSFGRRPGLSDIAASPADQLTGFDPRDCGQPAVITAFNDIDTEDQNGSRPSRGPAARR
jgi:hypothetical protein